MPLATPTPEINALLQGLPWGQRLGAKTIKLTEGTQGLSLLKFSQDTLVALLPKLIVARSAIEMTENTFLELAESFIIYFSMPMLAGSVMKRIFHKVAQNPLTGKAMKVEHLTTSLEDLNAAHGKQQLSEVALKRVLATKFAIAFGALGVTVASGEYLINYAKNLMTVRFFKKDNFSDIVNLSKGQIDKSKPSLVEAKAIRRIKECLIATVGLMSGAVAIGITAHRLPLKTLQKIVSHTDFKYEAGKYGLKRPHMLAFMALAFPAYIDASRDSLERVEAASRLGVVMGYLAFGQEALQKLLVNGVKKTYQKETSALKVLTEKNEIKTVAELSGEALKRARMELGDYASETSIQAHAQSLLTKPIAQKNFLFAVPMLTGILGAGIAVGLVNNFWTAYRFKATDKAGARAIEKVAKTNSMSPEQVNNAVSILQASAAAQLQQTSPIPPVVTRAINGTSAFISNPNNEGLSQVGTFLSPQRNSFSSVPEAFQSRPIVPTTPQPAPLPMPSTAPISTSFNRISSSQQQFPAALPNPLKIEKQRSNQRFTNLSSPTVPKNYQATFAAF